ncbi:hypothetical protein ONZ45_g16995 [Pleurotus djamor]|nr:hypothetical protein ONZ45_g16995 [Pleurotus djamor]
MQACVRAGTTPASNDICRFADSFCNYTIYQPAVGDRFEYDLRQRKPGFIPTEYYLDFLNSPEVRAKLEIPADVKYNECSNEIDLNFRTTGDEARSTTPLLAELANTGMNILIWAGDADIACNWVGGLECIHGMDWYGQAAFNKLTLRDLTFGGVTVGASESFDNFTYAIIYDAGHEVPAYQPAVAFEVFKQMIVNGTLQSV